MNNHRVYGENVEKHQERTPITKFPESFIDMLERFHDLTRNETVLDIGCGTGRDLRYLHNILERNDISYGLDASNQMTDFAKNKTKDKNIRYLNGDITSLPLTSNQIGGIWCQATIFMVGIEGIKQSASEIHRVMKPDGIGVISFKLSDKESSDNGIQYRHKWGSTVQYYFVDEDITTKLLEDAGFKILDKKFTKFGDTKFLNTWIEPT